MEDKEKLKKCFEDIAWMAIRYAHGRHTYAPGMVRDAVKSFQEVFPDWKPKQDPTIEPPTEEELSRAAVSRGDYLDDLMGD